MELTGETCEEESAVRERPCRFLALLLAVGTGGVTVWACGSIVAEAAAPRTLLDVRYEGVVRQSDWFTCGPAAVATLLRYYFGLDVTEGDALAEALAITAELGLDVGNGISALALVRTLERFGVPALGYRVTVEALADYFRRGGLPVIVHLTAPEPHYAVAVGMAGEFMLLADPSWGRRVERWADFSAKKGFSGVVLVPLPSGALHARVMEAQREAVRALEAHAARLAALSRWVARP